MRDERRRPFLRSVRRAVFRRPSASFLIFIASFALYVAIGAVLVLHYGSVAGDGQARVANAWYVFFSRDPHLAAIGFVWNPLPSVFVMPFFALKSIWPALTERAFAGNVMSAVAMAGCVVQLRLALRDLRVGLLSTWILTAAFALNPMILYYGANGMSEAPYLFFLILGTRYVFQWTSNGGVRPLVLGGIAFGLGYLVRYEAAIAAATAIVVVLMIGFARGTGSWRARGRAASSDTIVLALPFVAAFCWWSVVSYVITGAFFGQLSSEYGNASQLKIIGGVGGTGTGYSAPVYGAIQMLGYAPLLPLLALVVVVVAWRRRDARALALLVLAAPVAFTYAGFLSGKVYGWYRYYMPALPLALLAVGLLLSMISGDRVRPWANAAVGAFAALLFAATSAVATGIVMWNPSFAPADYGGLAWVASGKAEGSYQLTQKTWLASGRAIARKIDALDLPPGSIVVDDFTGCVSTVLMNSRSPHQFVITSDRDFQRTLADPLTFHARYLMVPPQSGYGSLNAVNRAYPSLYDNGAGVAKLVKQFDTPGCPAFRLYRVTGSGVRSARN